MSANIRSALIVKIKNKLVRKYVKPIIDVSQTRHRPYDKFGWRANIPF